MKFNLIRIYFLVFFVGCTHNYEPVIISIIADPNPVQVNGVVNLKCDAKDDDTSSSMKDEEISYDWYASTGEVQNGESPELAIWTAPSEAGYYSITCTVTDQYDGTDIKTISVIVQ